MAKVTRPRALYRLWTQKIDPVTLEVVGTKSPYYKAILMQTVVFEWYRLCGKEGFDHLEIHVEQRHGDKWIEISQLWGSFLEPSDVLAAHMFELEFLGWNLDWLEVDEDDDL